MCPDQIMDLLIQTFFLFAGIVLALWYENLGSSKLIFYPGETLDLTLEDGKRARSLRIKIKNVPRKLPFVPRQTASSCHGTIVFLDTQKKAISNPMQIRWVDSPEPIKKEILNNQIINLPEPNLIRLSRYIVIPPDESELCDLAIRFFNENTAYGWCTDSYFKNMRHSDYTLNRGSYFAKVSILTGDSKFEAIIPFSNPPDYKNFNLGQF